MMHESHSSLRWVVSLPTSLRWVVSLPTSLRSVATLQSSLRRMVSLPTFSLVGGKTTRSPKAGCKSTPLSVVGGKPAHLPKLGGKSTHLPAVGGKSTHLSAVGLVAVSSCYQCCTWTGGAVPDACASVVAPLFLLPLHRTAKGRLLQELLLPRSGPEKPIMIIIIRLDDDWDIYRFSRWLV